MNNRKHCQMHALKQGKMYVRLKCPYCNKEFELPRNKSFLVKHTKYNCNCCSNYCKGRFFRDVQLFGLTHKMESAISENLLAEYKVYIDEDNSEETCL